MTSPQVRGPAPVRIVFDGQSMNVWPPAWLYDGAGPYPARLMARHGGVPSATVAISNTSWAALTTTAVTRRDPHARNRQGCTDVLVMSGGQSDIGTGTSGAATYALAAAYADAARGAGFGVVICTTNPAFDPFLDGSQQAQTDAYNAAVTADALGAFDAVADCHSGVLGDGTDPAYFELDRVHLRPYGAAAMAARVAAVLDPILADL